MSSDQIANIFIDPTGQGFFYLFFKAFAVLFAVSYLVYAIVITRQTDLMNKTFTTKNSGLLFAVSFFQIVFGLILIAVSVFLI
ncbi:hypothetical protein KBD81_00730 [Candidatus Woesebacteria bacterium]|nr:hypothetical protein [Candidatus Woesebacteria bacterium]